MRGATAALPILFAAILTGCGSEPGRAFSAEFPPLDFAGAGDVHRGPLPVVLHDLTGTVVAFATDEHDPEHDFGGPDARVLPAVDRPNAIRAFWLGGMCTTAVRIQLSGVNDAFVLTIRDDWDPPIFGGVCPAGGVPRVVLIGFSRPVDPAAIEVRTTLEG